MAKAAIAKGIRKAYAPLFEANEAAHDLPFDQLKGLIAQVSGADERAIRQIAGTFSSLTKTADFTAVKEEPIEEQSDSNGKEPPAKDRSLEQLPPVSRFSPDFHFNIQVHLPSNGTEDTYLAIFNALRRSLG